MYQNKFLTVSQDTLQDRPGYNLQLKRNAEDTDNASLSNGKRTSRHLDDHELSNDLTGKTLEDEILSFQQGTSIRAMGDRVRRLSISELHWDHPMFYEYEFFSKDALSKNSIGPASRQGSDCVLTDDEAETGLMRDVDMHQQFPTSGQMRPRPTIDTKESFSMGNVTNSMALLLSSLDEDVSVDLDMEVSSLGSDATESSGVKRLFNFNKMFKSSTRDLTIDDEPQQIFKKKYFWSRKPTVPILKNSGPVFESSEGTDGKATFNLGNPDLPWSTPSHLNSPSCQHPDLNDEEITTSIVNPLKLLATSNTKQKKRSDSITLRSSSKYLKSLEPEVVLSSNSSLMSSVPTSSTESTFDNTSTQASPSMTPMSTGGSTPKKLHGLSLSKLNIDGALGSVLIKKQQGPLKTRGRKPSPLLDASKPFACEFCDRRFKRQEHLKRHIRSLHMCEKPYSCHICGKKFSRSDNLSQHLKTHTHTHLQET